MKAKDDLKMKTLIYFYEDFMKPSGGPSGYLYNLKKRRDELGDKEIVFLSKKEFRRPVLYGSRNRLHKLFGTDKTLPENARRVEQVIYESEMNGPFDLNEYDIVHFHNTFDLYSQKKNLENFKGKVLLTSHTPMVPHKEFIGEYCTPEEYAEHKEIYDKVAMFDRFSFERADYIVFPCREAEEPYFHTWDEYESLRKQEKILYVPTGVPVCVPEKAREEVRSELSIPDDRFVISFTGRHNTVKGYDSLISMFGKLDGVTVLCCGKETGIRHPESPCWIETGWTDDPYSYVNASDLFILPNRETFFDLSLLETLSVGKSSLISYTGGNKVFKDREECGIYTYGSEEEALNRIRRIMSEDKAEKAEKEARQRKFFEEEYSIEKFYDRYKEMLRSICS